MKRENNLGNWGKWRCYEVSHLLLCNNYGRAQKKLLTSSIIEEMKNGEKMKQVSSKVQVLLTWISQFLSKNSLEAAATKSKVFEALEQTNLKRLDRCTKCRNGKRRRTEEKRSDDCEKVLRKSSKEDSLM